MTAWPCEKFIVRLVTQVMWYPRATSPYMLPRASPVTTSWTSTLLHRDGHDLAALPDDHDVILVGEGVVLVWSERRLVRLDEPLVLGLEVLEGIADLRPVRGTGLCDRQGNEMQAVIGVCGAHRRDDLFGTLHAVLVLERVEDRLAALVLLTEEGIGLQERDAVRQVARQLGEPAARNSPMGHHGDLPADLGAGFHDLRP